MRIVAIVLYVFWSNLCHVSGNSCLPYQPAPREDLRQLATAVNELAVALHKRLSADSSQNLVFSPLSIAIVFEMLFYGARGDTAEELRRVLGHKKAGMSDQRVHTTFHKFICGTEIAKNLSSSQAKEVPMMQRNRAFNYSSGADYEKVELPYHGDNFSMLVYPPHRRDEFVVPPRRRGELVVPSRRRDKFYVPPRRRDELTDFERSSTKISSSGDGLTIANTVLVDEQHVLLPEYKNAVERLYQAPVQNVDFAKHSDVVLQQVNDWVKEKTNGKIPKIIDEVNEDAVMILLNAVHFKESWINPFDEVKRDSPPFYNYGSNLQAKQVPMMRRKSSFKYGSGADYEALELPYKGDNFSMLVLLPHRRDGLADFERSLTSEKLTQIQDRMGYTDVIATLSKFNINYSRELSGDFKALGAVRTFDERSADFTGMTSSRNMYVNLVDHVATIEVNEKGSEAAAATAVTVNRITSVISFDPPTPFVVDRPFLFAILDKSSGMIVMMGRVIRL